MILIQYGGFPPNSDVIYKKPIIAVFRKQGVPAAVLRFLNDLEVIHFQTYFFFLEFLPISSVIGIN